MRHRHKWASLSKRGIRNWTKCECGAIRIDMGHGVYLYSDPSQETWRRRKAPAAQFPAGPGG